MGGVEVGVLGTAVVTTDVARLELGAAKQRALLSILALHRGKRVATETIVAALWGDRPPAGAAGTLQGYVADLRRVLEPHRAPREAPTVLVTVPGGYSLHLDAEAVDAARFEADVRRAAGLLDVVPQPWRPAVSGADRTAVTEARDLLDDALALWRGDPLCDLGSDVEVEVERDRLRALRLDAEVLRLTAVLALGGHATAVTDLERVARGNPWNERVWGLWAVALAGSGRQAEALACLRQLRTSLSDELGIDPSAELRDLETAIIRQELPPTGSAPAQVEAPGSVGREDELRTLDDILGLAARHPEASPAMSDLLDALAKAHGVHPPLDERGPVRPERPADESARAAVAECLQGLSPGTLALLGGASLLEPTFDADLLAHAADLRPAAARELLDPATAAGVLREEPGDRYSFRGDAVRDALAAALTPLPRARWHASFARVLEQRSGLDRPDRRSAMARHWRAAGYAFTAQAWRATAKAAQRALADGRPAEAALLLGEAARAQRWDRTATADDVRHLDTIEALVAAVSGRGPATWVTGEGPLRTA